MKLGSGRNYHKGRLYFKNPCAFNQEKAQACLFVIVKSDGSFAALTGTHGRRPAHGTHGDTETSI